MTIPGPVLWLPDAIKHPGFHRCACYHMIFTLLLWHQTPHAQTSDLRQGKVFCKRLFLNQRLTLCQALFSSYLIFRHTQKALRKLDYHLYPTGKAIDGLFNLPKIWAQNENSGLKHSKRWAINHYKPCFTEIYNPAIGKCTQQSGICRPMAWQCKVFHLTDEDATAKKRGSLPSSHQCLGVSQTPDSNPGLLLCYTESSLLFSSWFCPV